MDDREGTGERVYRLIKRFLADGPLRSGERLDVSDLARRFSASATPVRAALNRLTGERLLSIRQGEGFHIPRLSEPALRDLYHWNGAILLQALGPRPAAGLDVGHAVEPTLLDDSIAAAARLFQIIGERSANGEYAAAIDSANDRLHRVRRAERDLIGAQADEVGDLSARLARGDIAGLRRGLMAYHRRRLRLTPALVRALHGLAERETSFAGTPKSI